MLNVKHNTPLNLNNFSKFLNSINFIKNNHSFAVAVSGGVDSITLLHLSDLWAKEYKKELYVISFNHNLRKESLHEVNYVGKISRELGWKYKTLNWNTPSKTSVLEEARNARYTAFSKFCKKKNIKILFLGHHLDDLVESFSMRVLQKSRIEGLCPMFPTRRLFDMNLVRPLLGISKSQIYLYARQNSLRYFEDPSNKDFKYLRTKVRLCIEKNHKLKLELLKSTVLFCKLRNYLDLHTSKFFLKDIQYKEEGYVEISKQNFLKLPEFLILKVLNKVIMDIGNKKYPIRSRTLGGIIKILLKDIRTTKSVGGCLVKNQDLKISVIREFNKLKNLNIILKKENKVLWDNKFIISNLSKKYNFHVTPLGKELENKIFYDFYKSKKRHTKKLSFNLKKTLPVIKTLEGYIYIPHLNIYNNAEIKNFVSLQRLLFL